MDFEACTTIPGKTNWCMPPFNSPVKNLTIEQAVANLHAAMPNGTIGTVIPNGTPTPFIILNQGTTAVRHQYGLAAGTIAGMVVSAIVAITIVSLAIWILCRRLRRAPYTARDGTIEHSLDNSQHRYNPYALGEEEWRLREEPARPEPRAMEAPLSMRLLRETDYRP
jgi:hypothetical protein